MTTDHTSSTAVPARVTVRAARVPAWAWVMQSRSSDAEAARAHVWTYEMEGQTDCSRRRPSGRPGARSAVLEN
jgi:hypothetical protein